MASGGNPPPLLDLGPVLSAVGSDPSGIIIGRPVVGLILDVSAADSFFQTFQANGVIREDRSHFVFPSKESFDACAQAFNLHKPLRNSRLILDKVRNQDSGVMQDWAITSNRAAVFRLSLDLFDGSDPKKREALEQDKQGLVETLFRHAEFRPFSDVFTEANLARPATHADKEVDKSLFFLHLRFEDSAKLEQFARLGVALCPCLSVVPRPYGF